MVTTKNNCFPGESSIVIPYFRVFLMKDVPTVFIFPDQTALRYICFTKILLIINPVWQNFPDTTVHVLCLIMCVSICWMREVAVSACFAFVVDADRTPTACNQYLLLEI